MLSPTSSVSNVEWWISLRDFSFFLLLFVLLFCRPVVSPAEDTQNTVRRGKSIVTDE
jgi:hypothetical protein